MRIAARGVGGIKEMDQFLEVLLEGFQLTRCDGARGVELSVAFDDDTPVIRNRQDRESVRDGMGAYYDAVVEEYQRRLHALLLDGTAGSFSPYDPKFRWRWASAGTLPILSRDGQSACDSRSELLDPSQAMERELAEELVIVSRSGRTRYTLPFKWEAGPGTVILKTPFHDVRRLENYIVNINATDFGIELDRIAHIAVPDDAVLCDREITNGRPLNRPVGLFKVDRLQREVANGHEQFSPDLCFYGGEEFPGADFPGILDRQAANKLGLCPVTYNLIRRHSTAGDLL